MSNLERGMNPRRLASFLSAEGSRGYHTKYQRWNKRLAHHVECGILHRMLGQVDHSHEILDAPSGPGRFFDTIKQHADEVHLGDISAHMLDVAREQTHNDAASYSVVNLLQARPNTRTYEGVVSLRLTHHIYEAQALEEYFQVLNSMTRQWLIISFRDARAPLTMWRRMSRRIRNKGFLPAQTVEQIADSMRHLGLHLVDDVQVSRWFSGHCYALFVRNPN